jgi:hypothetical protein
MRHGGHEQHLPDPYAIALEHARQLDESGDSGDMARRIPQQPNPPPRPTVPKRYGSPETSRLSIEVQRQPNTVSLDLENR